MKKITFKMPDGVMIPEDKEVGDTFDVLATIKLEADGRACLKAIDGEALPGYKDNDGDEDDNRTYAEASADAMEESEGY